MSTDKDLGMTQMLEAGKISEALNEILNNPRMTHEDMEIVVKNIFVDMDMVRSSLSNIADLRSANIMPWDRESIIPAFRKTAIMQYVKYRQSPPNLSGVGLSFFPSQGKTIPRYILEKNVFTMGMKPGRAGAILGISGSGKTDFATQEIYKDCVKLPNWFTSTNIFIKNPVKNKSQYTSICSDALKTSLRWDLSGYDDNQERNNAWLLDEQQRDRDRQQASKIENVSWKHLTLVIRKIGGFQWVIYQQNKLPSELFEFCSHWITKTSFNNKGLATYTNDIYNFKLRINGIKGMDQRKAEPNTEYYEYETKHFSGMLMDIFPDKAFAYLSTLGEMNAESQKRAFLEYLDKAKDEVTGIIPDQMKMEMAWIIHHNLKKSKDRLDRKVSTVTYLAKMFNIGLGGDAGRQQLTRAFKKFDDKTEKPEIREPDDIMNMKPDKVR